MKAGALVRQKQQDPSGPLMTVKAITAQGWIVCSWSNPATCKNEARMFFPEMLEEVGSSPQKDQPE
jgi:uncharacterized protein YodC (DUF2158 family)